MMLLLNTSLTTCKWKVIRNGGRIMISLADKRIKKFHDELKENRTKLGITRKSHLEEVLNSYLNGNYRLAFIGAYIHLAKPIAIYSKRLYKPKRMKKFMKKIDPYKFNLSKATEQCIFLNQEMKDEINKVNKMSFYSPRTHRKFYEYLTLSQIRNLTVHPEDNLHAILTEQCDYKSFALETIELAIKVHDASNKYYFNKQIVNNRKNDLGGNESTQSNLILVK